MVMALQTGCPSGWLEACVFGAAVFLPGGILCCQMSDCPGDSAFCLGTVRSPFL